MTPHGRLIVVLADRAQAPPAGADTAWWFGVERSGRAAVAERWAGTLAFAPLASVLDDAAERLAGAVIDIDGQVLADESARPAWSASDIGDRGPYATCLFEGASKLVAFLELPRDGRTHVAVFDDPAWALAFVDAARAEGLPVSWDGKAPARCRVRLAAIARRTRSTAARIVHGLRFARGVLAVRRLRRRRPIDRAALARAEVVVASWAEASTFGPDGPARTIPNLGRLPDILREAGVSTAYVGLPLDWVGDRAAITRAMATAHDPVLLLEDCVGLIDIARAVFEGPALGWRLRGRSFRAAGHDLSAAFALALEEEVGKWRPVLSALYRRVGPTLARLGRRNGALVYPYEGQPWEKALIAGVRDAVPAGRIVGYQYGVFAPLHISFFPSAGERVARLVPDALLVTGRRYAEWFADRGWPEGEMTLGGGLRHAERLEQARAAARADERGIGRTVLCCCSIDAEESMEFVDKTARALAGRDDWRLMINFHPLTPAPGRQRVAAQTSVRRLIEAGRAEVSDEPFYALAAVADVVVYERSGAVFEGLARGLPAVFVRSDDMLDLNKIVEPEVPACLTPADIAEALGSASPGPAMAAIAEHYLAPTDVGRILEVVRPNAYNVG